MNCKYFKMYKIVSQSGAPISMDNVLQVLKYAVGLVLHNYRVFKNNPKIFFDHISALQASTVPVHVDLDNVLSLT